MNISISVVELLLAVLRGLLTFRAESKSLLV